MPAHDRRLAVLRWLLGLSILSTALHFTHNFVAIDQYPQSDAISNTAVQVAIVVSWPLLTAIGLLGMAMLAFVVWSARALRRRPALTA